MLTVPSRRVPTGHGGSVSPAFWIVAACLPLAMVARLPIDGSTTTLIATLVFIGGGLPHGAYDIALLARLGIYSRRELGIATVAYIAIACGMAMLWLTVPLAALILFLLVAAIHFGEDWTMIDEPLFKMAAGAAVIAGPAIGHPVEVSKLFSAMTDETGGVLIARVLLTAAPVTLLVTAVGMVIAWRDGAREWAAATAVAIAMLLFLAPVVAFAFFFVFLHSPRHLADARAALIGMSRVRWLATGAAMSIIVIAAWLAFATVLSGSGLTAQAFQLLAAVAVPHLILSRWIERRLADPLGKPPAG